MLPFEIQLKHGTPVYEQVLYASKKAIVSGQLQPGDSFPSVRAISKELKVNPNTVQKAVTILKQEGFWKSSLGSGLSWLNLSDPIPNSAKIFWKKNSKGWH